MILYNVPGRTVADLQNDTVLRLAQVPGHHRHQGRHRQHRARHRPHQARCRADFADLQRRRRDRARADAARRPRRDLGHRQRRAAPDARDVRRRAGRRREDARARSTFGCCRCTSTLFVEANPIPVKWALAADGPDRVRHAPADDAALARSSTRRVREALHEAGIALPRPARRGRDAHEHAHEPQLSDAPLRRGAAVAARGLLHLDVRRASVDYKTASRSFRRSRFRPTSPRRSATTATRCPTRGRRRSRRYSSERTAQRRPGATGVLPQVENVRIERLGAAALAGREGAARQGVAGGARVLAGERLPAQAEDRPRSA